MATGDVVVLSIDTSIITCNFIKNSALKYQDYGVQLKNIQGQECFEKIEDSRDFDSTVQCTSTLYVKLCKM